MRHDMHVFWFTLIGGMSTVKCNLLAIDLGVSFTKAAHIKRAAHNNQGSFEILYSPQSNRKMRSSVTLSEPTRLFGDDSYTRVIRPQQPCFDWIKEIIYDKDNRGSYENDALKLYGSYEEVSPESDDELQSRNMKLRYFRYGNEIISSIGLLSQYLSWIKGLSPELKGKVETAVCVTCDMRISERQRLVQALNRSNFSVIGVYGRTAAAASFFAQELEIKEDVFYIFIDMGAGSTEISLVKYIVKDEKSMPIIRVIDCKCVAASSIDVDLYLAMYIRENSGLNDEILKSKKALNRILKYAADIKHKLSVTDRIKVNLENILPNKDIQFPLKRETIEEEMLARSGVHAIVDHVNSLLHKHNLRTEDIRYFELIGGGWRIPVVRGYLEKSFSVDKLGFHLNPEEASVQGALLLGAGNSKKVKTTKLELFEPSPVTLKVQILALTPELEISTLVDEITILNRDNTFTGSNVIRFNMIHDFAMKFLENDKELFIYKVTEVTPFCLLQQAMEAEVEIAIRVDEIAGIGIEKATVSVKRTLNDDSIGQEGSNTKGESSTPQGSSNMDQNAQKQESESTSSTADSDILQNEQQSEQSHAKSDEKNAGDASATTDTGSSAEAAESRDGQSTFADTIDKKNVKETKPVLPSATLKIIKIETPDNTHEKDLELSQLLEKREKDHRRRNKMLNDFEGYVYTTRRQIRDDEEVFSLVHGEDMFKQAISSLEEYEDWIMMSGKSSLDEIRDKKNVVVKEIDAWIEKYKEYLRRDDVINQVTKTIELPLISTVSQLEQLEKKSLTKEKEDLVAASKDLRVSEDELTEWWGKVYKNYLDANKDPKQTFFTLKEATKFCAKVIKYRKALGITLAKNDKALKAIVEKTATDDEKKKTKKKDRSSKRRSKPTDENSTNQDPTDKEDNVNTDEISAESQSSERAETDVAAESPNSSGDSSAESKESADEF